MTRITKEILESHKEGDVEVQVLPSELLAPRSITVATTTVGEGDEKRDCAVLDVDDCKGTRKVILFSADQLDEVLKGLMDARCALKTGL